MSKSSHGTRGWELKGDRIGMGLVVILPDRTRHEVDVRGDPASAVGEVATAIGSHLGLPAEGELYLFRTGSWLEPADTLASASLLHGDRIFFGPRSALPSDDRSESTDRDGELVVVGGPSIGMRWSLRQGSTRVGRGRDCDVTIDDPALSRTHFLLEVEGDAVRITDAGSTNGSFLNGIRLGDRHQLRPGEVFEAGASLFGVEPRRPSGSAPVSPNAQGRVLFNRPPRIASPDAQVSFEVPAPPSGNERLRLPLATAVVPLVIALVLWQLFPDNPSLLAIMALSPIVVIFSYVEDRRRGARGARRSTQEWRISIAELLTKIAAARDAFAERTRVLTPAAAELQLRARERAANLWERRPHDEDFLLLRCGWGDRSWPLQLHRPPGAGGALQEEADAKLEPLRTVPSVPLTVDLRAAGVVSLSGDIVSVEAAARWLILQLATLHSPEDVSIATVLDGEAANSWRWMSWLPHAERAPAEVPMDAPQTVDELLATLEIRSDQAHGERGGRSGTLPAIVVLAHHRAPTSRASLTRLLREGPGAGILIIWMGAARADLPGETGAIVELTGADDIEITITKTGALLRGVREGVTEAATRDAALTLAPLIDAAPARMSEELPREVPLYALFDLDEPGSEHAPPWDSSSPGLSIPIGVGQTGRVEIDLVSDGPHTLVGGMTGSGKSELLQTLVVALAWRRSPARVNFLLIDYKGGAAFKDCVDLPHTLGLVTDLDAHLARRALVSLDAELKHRELLLRDAGARDISELPDGVPLARLIIVIDEFAALVKELPNFVDGVMDIAQRGRSLGLHLILATQRPAGVINDAIRANTNLRIALRVADESDSDDVLGIRDAAHVPRSVPGRAFLKRGHNEVEAFQTAFSGAIATRSSDAVEVRDRRVSTPRSGLTSATAVKTQLEATVASIHQAFGAAGLPAPRSPWLPPLPDLLPLDTLGEQEAGVLGLSDRPEQQCQDVERFDPARDGGLLVYGAGGSGKTTLMRTLATSLAACNPLAELHLYALDFGSGGLQALSSLPHCGDVVAGEEAERIERAFAMLRREVERRKALFATRGVSDLAEFHRVAPGMTLPRLVVMLDGYEAFSAAFDRVNTGELVDLFPRLVSDGRSLGIHFAVTGERRAGIPAALAALFPKRIILRMSDEDEYLSLGVDVRTVRDLKSPPGRGYIHTAQMQVAIVGKDPTPDAQRAAISELSARLDPGEEGRPPARVELLPSSVHLSSLGKPEASLCAIAGLGEIDLATATVDLTQGHFLVAGPYRSGRSTALLTIARSLRASTPSVPLWLLTPRKSPLAAEDIWTRIETGSTACAAAIEELGRRDQASPLVLFIDDADEVSEGPAAYGLEPLAKARDGAMLMVAAAESVALHRSFTGWISELRKHKHGLLLDPDLDLDGDLLGVKLPRRQKQSFPPGRGYLVVRGRIELVQTALP